VSGEGRMFHRIREIVLVSVLAGAMGGFVASVMVGTPSIAQSSDQTTFQVVCAQEFQLIDVKGRTRGVLALSANA